eukprot:g16542.t1
MAAAWCGVAILLAGFSQGLPQRMWRFVELLNALVPSLPSMSSRRFVEALRPAEGGAAPTPEHPAHPAAERLSVPLRVLLRVAKAAAAEKGDEVELVHGLLQQQLFPFMPKGERNKLVAQLSEHFPQAAPLAAERALHKASRQTQAETSVPAGHVRFGTFLAPMGEPKNPELVRSTGQTKRTESGPRPELATARIRQV